MQSVDLDELHEKTFEAAKEFHRICQKHHLSYYMIGGTMLGAFREKDFIPWDDDMDIAMPRKDYDRLLRNAEKIKSDIIKVEYPKDDKYPWPYARIFHKNTTLIQGAFNYPGGVFIDLYPLDGVGNNAVEQNMLLACFHLYNRFWMQSDIHNRILDNTKSIFTRIAKYRTRMKWYEKTELFLRRQSKRKNSYLMNYYGIYGKKEIMKKKVFGKPTLYQFHGTQFYGVEDADEYLKNLYGANYMTPPPLNNRRNTRHSYKYVNLNMPYKKYQSEGKIKNEI